MSPILVTGAQGMLGGRLVPHLKACGYEVAQLSRTGSAGLRADLTDAAQASAALNEISPRVIVNLAALTNVDECERQPQLAYRSNVRIVENLADWMRRHDQCHLVHISTDQIYDGAGPHVESAVTLTNYYGFSKYAGELAAATVASTVLRTNFFGPSNTAGRVSLSDWLLRSLTARDPITVFDDVFFSPLTLQTLVEQIERVIREPHRGVFNLGSRDGMSKADFAFAFAQTMGLPTTSMQRGNSATSGKLLAYRPKDMRMDSSRFERTYGVQLPTLQAQINSLRAGHEHKTG